MNEFPSISIVTPSFNQAEYIEETILSVLNQNYPKLEYIIIDGGSTDGSAEIIRKYESQLAYWVSEKDSGLYDALNKGFKRCTGEIMLWINSDDLLHKGALENIRQIFTQFKDIDWITGINTSLDEKSRVIRAHEAKMFSKYDFLLENFKWIQQESTVWRRRLWDKAGGFINSNLRLAGDFELWLRFIQIDNLFPCNILIGGFRLRSKNQLSSTHFNLYINEVKQSIKSARGMLSKKERLNVAILKFMFQIQLFLKYSIILDLRIFSLIIKKSTAFIHCYPGRLKVNTKTCNFELCKD